MKRFIAFLLACMTFSCVLASCGSADDEYAGALSSDSDDRNAPEEEKTSEKDKSSEKDKTSEKDTTSEKNKTTEKDTTSERDTTSEKNTTATITEPVTEEKKPLMEIPFNAGDVPFQSGHLTDDGSSKCVYSMWLDISQNKDLVFNGEFVKFRFKVSRNAPQGVYPMDIKFDGSDVNGISCNDKVNTISGNIGVKTPVTAQEKMTGSTVYAENVTAEAGSEIEYIVSFQDNPGIAAFIIYLNYNADIFEYLGCEPVGEFKEAANKLTTGSIS